MGVLNKPTAVFVDSVVQTKDFVNMSVVNSS